MYSIIDHSVITPTLKRTSIHLRWLFYYKFLGCESASVDWLEKNERDVTHAVMSNQGQRGRVARALDSSPGGPEFECHSHHYLILGHSNTSFK